MTGATRSPGRRLEWPCSPFTLRYVRLPERFYARFDPEPVVSPRLVADHRRVEQRGAVT